MNRSKKPYDRTDIIRFRRRGRAARGYAGAGLALAIALGAMADERVVLPEIVVTPSREPEARPVVPAAVDRISLRDNGSSGLRRSFPETLRETPSVMSQKTAHGMGSPYLRGFTGFRTLALIDGIRLNNSVFREGPNQYWATIDPASLERIEAVLGPASVMYGSDAIGGAVNALPPTPPDAVGWHGRARYRGATAEAAHGGRIELAGRPAEPLGVMGGLTVNSFGDLRGGRNVGRQRRTGYDERAADARLLWDFGANRRLTLAHQSVRQDDVWRTHRTVYGLTWKGLKRGDDLAHVFDQARDLTYARIEGAEGDPVLTVYRHAQSEDLYRVRSDRRAETQGFDVAAWGISAQAARAFGTSRWTLGTEYQLDLVDSYGRRYAPDGTLKQTEIQGPVADDARYHLAGLYLQNRRALTDDQRIELVSGVRYTYARAEADRIKDPITGRPFRLEEDWDAVVGSLRGLARLGSEGQSIVYAGVSQGFRAPNLSDLSRLDIARSNEFEVPTTDLDPEYYTSYEAGVRFAGAPVTLEIAAYHTAIDGMIVRTPTGRMLEGGLAEVTKRNAGDGYVRGAEARLDLALAREWTVWGQTMWMEGEVDGYPDSSPRKVREPVSRLMPLTFRAGLQWSAPHQRAWVEIAGEAAEKADRLSAADRRDTQRIPPGGTPGYAVCHLRAGARVTSDLRLTAALENLFDADYRIHGSGVNEPGRNLVLTAEWRF